MAKFKLGDVVLLNFPYTDGVSQKKRPALVVADTQDGDVVLCRITSQQKMTSYDIEIENWKQAGLLLPSIVRLHKIAALEISLVEKKLGQLQKSDLDKIKAVIKDILNKI